MAESRQAGADTWRWHLRAVGIATGFAFVLHAVWLVFLARPGGDLAAQDAWTWFAVIHPSSAYDFAWYGGVHPAAYSLISPYIMGALGVRLTMLVTGTLSAGLIALILGNVAALKSPTWAVLYSTMALAGDAVSGRVTFALGVLFGLTALTILFVPYPRAHGSRAVWWRFATAGVLAGLTTASSPVAGLFLGLVAVSLWLNGQRRAALAMGTAPLAVVLGAVELFPSDGIEPMSWSDVVLPVVVAIACWALLPRGWRLVRIASVVYAGVVLGARLVPSPIGTNVSRLGLVFGGVLLVAGASGAWWTSPVSRRVGRPVARLVLAAAILTASTWQVTIAGLDLVGSASAASLDAGVPALLTQLSERGAVLGRVEVVPTKSHVEAAALTPHVVLARGWNRQVDVSRNPIFYREGPIPPATYHRWLRHWGVRLVVLPHAALDYAGQREGALVRSAPAFLREVWSDPNWSLYAVTDPLPIVSSPGSLRSWNSDGVTVQMSRAGSATVRVAWSPWLSIVDAAGRREHGASIDGSCLAHTRAASSGAVMWVILDARSPGRYRIGAPYAIPRGTPCPVP